MFRFRKAGMVFGVHKCTTLYMRVRLLSSSVNILDELLDPQDVDTTTPHSRNVFRISITNKLSIGDAPNGGYLMAVALAGVRRTLPHLDPMTVTGHYLNKALEDKEARVEVEVLHASKSTACAEVSIWQEDKIRCKFIGTYGDRTKLQGISLLTESCPTFAPKGECINASEIIRNAFGDKLRIQNYFDMLVAKDDPFALSTLRLKPSKTASLKAWVRFAGGSKLSAAKLGVGFNSLAFFCDALPPPVLNISLADWVPTIEYTVHFWRDPFTLDASTTTFSADVVDGVPEGNPDGNNTWMRGYFRSPTVANGVLYTDGDLWSADGKHLLAKSRQMARLLSRR